jgi:tetratricopeptide (TPR) repeat protein
MKHHPWQDRLPFYAAGTLPPAARTALDDHLAGCAQCRADLHQWQDIAGAVRSGAAARVTTLPPLRSVTRDGHFAHQESNPMINTTTSYPPKTRSRQLPLTLAAALLLVILSGSVFWAAARRHSSGTAGAPLLRQDTATPTPIPSPTMVPPAAVPVVVTPEFTLPTMVDIPGKLAWLTNTTWLTADNISIVAQGEMFSPAGQSVEVNSDPGDKTYTTLELTWYERDVEMRLYMYFRADDQNWWAFEIRTYDGQPDGEWITYNADSPYFMTPLGQPFTAGDFTIGDASGDQITFRNLRLQAFLSTPPIPAGPSNETAQAEQYPPSTVQLDGIRYEAQGWNNAGPANLAMALSYWGWEGDQTIPAVWLKPNAEDKSVSPWQMVYYVNRFTDFNAIYRLGGTTYLMKQLLAAGFPVIVETGIEPPDQGWMGHYRLLYGYIDDQGIFLVHDSTLGEDLIIGYQKLDEDWQSFSRAYIVVYDPARKTDLRRALGDYADPVVGAANALDAARAALSINRDDAWGWFSMGTAYVTLGDYENAAVAYREAIQLGLPFRTMWYQFGPYEAYFHTGRYSALLDLVRGTLATTEYVEEAYYWRAMAQAAQGDAESAAASFAEVIRLNPNFLAAQSEYFHLESASFDLPPLILYGEDYIMPANPGEIIGKPTVPPPPVTPIVLTPTVVPPPSPTLVPTPTITATPVS